MADAIKKELAERAQRAIVSFGLIARGEVRAGGNDDVMLAARGFANHERNICMTESAMADLDAVVGEMDKDLAALASAASRLPIARAGLLATLDVARCDGHDASCLQLSDGISRMDASLSKPPAGLPATDSGADAKAPASGLNE